MKRKICDYYLDEQEDSIALLDCHHGQHVRHRPPFTNRPWVETKVGRAEKTGMEFDCVRCDRFEFPEGLVSYKSTPEFTEDSIPAGLLKAHSTKVGTWGMIRIKEGRLAYRALGTSQILDSDHPGVVVPKMLHEIAANGPVRFCVEFYGKPQ